MRRAAELVLVDRRFQALPVRSLPEPQLPVLRQVDSTRQIHGVFETFLQRLSPALRLFTAAKAMLRDTGDSRADREREALSTIKTQIAGIARQSENLFERIMATDAPSLIRKYEARLAELETEELILAEKLTQAAAPARPVAEVLELSLGFLANPWKIWEKGGFDLQRTLLKLVLAEPFDYHRKTGARTPKTTSPFRCLGRDLMSEYYMVQESGQTSNRLSTNFTSLASTDDVSTFFDTMQEWNEFLSK